MVTISMITIYGRIHFISRMPCVNVSVDGDVVKRFTDVSGWTNDKYTFPVLRVGRVVNITKDCDSNSTTINICEVQVWECVDGWYGTDCSQTCGNCISSSDCNKMTGRCTSCQTGFSLPLCKEPLMTTLTSSSVQATVTQYPSFLSTVGMSCDKDKETVSVAGPVAGAAVGCTVVFFIIGAIFGWWLRKSRSQQPSARGNSPHEIPMTSDAGTPRPTSHPDNFRYSNNVYDEPNAPDDSNTTAYTSLDANR